MRLTLITFILGLAGFGFCAVDTDTIIQEMTWTGALTPGGQNVTFQGTAESIYHQIKAANIYFEEGKVPEQVKALMKRANIVGWGCDRFPNRRTPKSKVIDQINYLYSIGGQGRTCGIKPQCVRVSCSYNSGIWGCSRTGGPISPPCSDLADVASSILGRCDRPGGIGANAATPNYYVDVHSVDC